APAAVCGEVLGHHQAWQGRPTGAQPQQECQPDPRSNEGPPDPLRATGTSPAGQPAQTTRSTPGGHAHPLHRARSLEPRGTSCAATPHTTC
ncbi:hypothetical protein PIB30_115496, partial [Stylosanthes scabra]|nr:hypothetical protein [Stylosanthes scabra]